MNRIKVVMIVPSLVTGGAENMVCQLSKALNKERFYLELVCLSSKQNTLFEKDLSNMGIKVKHLNNKGKLSFKTLFSLWRLLDKFKPDIVHTHLHASLYAFPWILFHKVPLLHTIHSTPKFEFSSRIIWLMKRLYLSKKAVPVAISNIMKMETAKLYNIPITSIDLINNPVDIEKFKTSKVEINNRLNFIHVARLNPLKNQKLLLQAFANVKKKLRNANLVIVGDGELRTELEALVFKLNLMDSVTFTGNIPNVEKYLRNSDIFVLCSTYEGLPLSILEAMATGLPIISTNVGGIEDVIDNNGILCESGDLQALTTAMLQLSNDPLLRAAMSEASRKLSKKYDISIIAREYEDLYIKYTQLS